MLTILDTHFLLGFHEQIVKGKVWVIRLVEVPTIEPDQMHRYSIIDRYICIHNNM